MTRLDIEGIGERLLVRPGNFEANVDGASRVEDECEDSRLPDDYVVETSALLRARAEGVVPKILRRTTLDRRQHLHVDTREGSNTMLDADEIAKLLRERVLSVVEKAELLDLILRDQKNCGIGMTPGGDCAGIADLIYSLEANLALVSPEKRLLAVPNAAKGLLADPQEFRERLIYMERLLGEDMRGMPSAPFGTARGNPLLVDRNRVIENLQDFGFLYGTGGNGGLALFREISAALPDMAVVAAPKTIDGDVAVMGFPVQSLGFSTAVELYRQQIFAVEATTEAAQGVNVVEVFGRDGGLLAFESARTDCADKNGSFPVGQVVDSRLMKIMRRKSGSIMVLVPERPVSLENIATEVAKRKAKFGHCTVVVAEGFMPRGKVFEAIGEYTDELPRRTVLSYEARGALPNRHDMQMGRKLGEKMADLVADGVKGGHVVYYELGENPYHVGPHVAALNDVSTADSLDIYTDEQLIRNGVFW